MAFSSLAFCKGFELVQSVNKIYFYSLIVVFVLLIFEPIKAFCNCANLV